MKKRDVKINIELYEGEYYILVNIREQFNVNLSEAISLLIMAQEVGKSLEYVHKYRQEQGYYE